MSQQQGAVSLATLQQGGTVQEAKPKRGLLDLLADPRVKQGFGSVVGKAMNPERMLQLCVTAAKGNPKLLQCEPVSVLGAMMAAAALGLEPNTPQQQAFLIPYAKRGKNPDTNRWEVVGYECQFQIGYRGYITLAHRSPHIAYLQAECIHENDVFEHMIGSQSFFKFQKKLGDRGKPIGAFAFCKFNNGNEAACVLDMDELAKIRECSDTYTSLRDKAETETGYKQEQAKKKLAETPWVLWFDDMAAKSAIKKLAKQLPLEQGSALSAAAELDNDSSARVIDMGKLSDPVIAKQVFEEGMPLPAIEHQEEEDNFIPAVQGMTDAEPEPVQQQQQQSEEPAQQHIDAGPTASDLIARINKATDTDDVMSVLADMGGLSDADRKKVNRAASAKRAELEGGSGQMSMV